MKITDHGKWSIYQPATSLLERKNLPTKNNIVFSKRTPGSEDWYDYQSRFTRGTVLATVYEQTDGMIVAAAMTDASMMFPGNCQLIEIEGYSGADPQAEFGNKVYDPQTKTFSERKPPKEMSEMASMKKMIEELQAQVAKLSK